MSNEENSFIVDGISPDGNWLTVFEDDGETGYLYFCPMTENGEMAGIC